MIKINAPWLENAFTRINTGIDILPRNSSTTITEAEEYLAPFTLYVLSSDDDYCYVAVKPALVNEIVPSISVGNEYVSIEAEDIPALGIDLDGKHYVYLNFILNEESTALEVAEVSTEAGDYHLELGYIENGVATSYRSTSLGVHICNGDISVWAC